MSTDTLINKQRMTEAELAAYWGVTRNTLQKWRASGTGPVYIKIGGHVIYPREYILQYEKKRMYQGTAKRIQESK